MANSVKILHYRVALKIPLARVVCRIHTKGVRLFFWKVGHPFLAADARGSVCGEEHIHLYT